MEIDVYLHLHRLPVAQLRARLPLCVRALLTLMRVLPAHAAAEQRRLRETLDTLLSRCLPPAPPEEPHSTGAQASAPAEPMDTSTRTGQVCACGHAVLGNGVFRASVRSLSSPPCCCGRRMGGPQRHPVGAPRQLRPGPLPRPVEHQCLERR